ncbi:MAG: alpha/beta fold hydrolase [Candidatus Binataceae bacterium]
MPIREFAKSHDDLNIRYEIRGAGEPVALIMGFSASMRGWGEPFLAAMENRFKLVLIDNRGTGESDKPDRPWTLADMASDVAAVLDHARIARAHIYGISMGGMIAQEFVLSHASKTRALVLGCTNCGMKHSIAAAPEDVAALMPDPGLSPAEQARKAFAVACGKKYLASKEGQAYLDQAIADIGSYPVTPMHTFMRQGGAIAGFDSWERLAQIKSPTLIIHGDDDRIVPVQNAEVIGQRIAGSKVRVIKDAGHMFFWEAISDAAGFAGDFLAAVK